MLRIIAIDVLAGLILLLAWYFWFLRYNRRKAVEVLRRIERTFHGHGEVANIQWLTASRFQVQLRLSPALFQQAALMVRLFPREQPFRWLLSRLRKQQETLTFQADLDGPPSFNLEVHNHRWYGRTRRRFPAKTQAWTLEQAGPFVLTTRHDWQRDITCMMRALVASRDCDCLTVRFRRTSPHFSVTVPLDTIAPDSAAQAEIFDVLRELAAGAASARF